MDLLIGWGRFRYCENPTRSDDRFEPNGDMTSAGDAGPEVRGERPARADDTGTERWLHALRSLAPGALVDVQERSADARAAAAWSTLPLSFTVSGWPGSVIRFVFFPYRTRVESDAHKTVFRTQGQAFQ
jgi:hypothetical protein